MRYRVDAHQTRPEQNRGVNIVAVEEEPLGKQSLNPYMIQTQSERHSLEKTRMLMQFPGEFARMSPVNKSVIFTLDLDRGRSLPHFVAAADHPKTKAFVSPSHIMR